MHSLLKALDNVLLLVTSNDDYKEYHYHLTITDSVHTAPSYGTVQLQLIFELTDSRDLGWRPVFPLLT